MMLTYASGHPINTGDLVRRGTGKRLWRVQTTAANYGPASRDLVVLTPTEPGHYTTASAMGDQINTLVLLCKSCQHGAAGHQPGCCVRGCTCTEVHL